MVMTGMVKLLQKVSGESHRKASAPNSLDHSIENFEEEAFLLIVQLFFTFLRDLLVHFLLPTKELDHTDDIHDLGDYLYA